MSLRKEWYKDSKGATRLRQGFICDVCKTEVEASPLSNIHPLNPPIGWGVWREGNVAKLKCPACITHE